jgi:NADPH-dependent ferric siderophore reductase
MMSNAPRIERVRHELKRRRLTVRRVERIAPHMMRVVLSGEDLQGFTSLGFDDHVKLFFSSGAADAPAMRDFTPRAFDATARELTIDFFLHDAGPAATWAAQASEGQSLEIGGPKGSAVISLDGIDAHVLIGDETALPAIARRLEELPANVQVRVLFEHEAGVAWPTLATRAGVEATSVARNSEADAPGHALIHALRAMQVPTANAFVWIALESQAARAVRRYFVDERGVDKRWIKAAGYWRRGAIGSHDTISDDE